MEAEAPKTRKVNKNFKVLDNKYTINMERLLSHYPHLFNSNEYDAFLRHDPTKLLTCIMISKPRMKELMIMNSRQWRNLPARQQETQAANKILHFINFVCDLVHENILKIVDLIQTSRNLYIILERYQTLTDYVDSRGPLKEKEVLSMSEGLVSALSHLSSKNIISARLNPDYLAVHQNKIKMNFLCFIEHHQIEQLSTDVYLKLLQNKTLFYSPQILMTSKLTIKCDVWSLGVIFYYLLSKKLAFEKYSHLILPKDTQYRIKIAVQNSCEMFKPLISRMLVIKQEERADISEIDRIFSKLSNKDDQSNHIKSTLTQKIDNS